LAGVDGWNKSFPVQMLRYKVIRAVFQQLNFCHTKGGQGGRRKARCFLSLKAMSSLKLEHNMMLLSFTGKIPTLLSQRCQETAPVE